MVYSEHVPHSPCSRERVVMWRSKLTRIATENPAQFNPNPSLQTPPWVWAIKLGPAVDICHGNMTSYRYRPLQGTLQAKLDSIWSLSIFIIKIFQWILIISYVANLTKVNSKRLDSMSKKTADNSGLEQAWIFLGPYAFWW